MPPIPKKKKIKIIIAVIIIGRVQNIIIEQGAAQDSEEPEVFEFHESELDAATCAMINAATHAAVGEGKVATLTITPGTPTALVDLADARVVEIEFVYQPDQEYQDAAFPESYWSGPQLAAIDCIADLVAG